MGPMPLRKFEQLVKEHGCRVERTTKEWKVVTELGERVSSFAVTHGRRAKSNEVKPFYVKQFMRAIKALRGGDSE